MLEWALPLITRANPVVLTSGSYFVAESARVEVVGCGGWTPESPDASDVEVAVGHVRHFGTHPHWTGRGIGRALHDESERQARSAGIGRLMCYSSLNAVPFYATLGYRAVRPIDVPIAPGLSFPAMLMERAL